MEKVVVEAEPWESNVEKEEEFHMNYHPMIDDRYCRYYCYCRYRYCRYKSFEYRH